MKARLAKKIVKASPLYNWYRHLYDKKLCKNRYWLQKWEKRRRITIYHQEGKYDIVYLWLHAKQMYIVGQFLIK